MPGLFFDIVALNTDVKFTSVMACMLYEKLLLQPCNKNWVVQYNTRARRPHNRGCTNLRTCPQDIL
jgi:hypothetical protein